MAKWFAPAVLRRAIAILRQGLSGRAIHNYRLADIGIDRVYLFVVYRVWGAIERERLLFHLVDS